jgi:hypothetical protein
MFCPKCKDEFVQGILICPDCKVSLCDQLPGESKETYEPVFVDLLTVMETADIGIIMIAKSLLEEAGIRYFAKGEGLQHLFGAGVFGAGFNTLTGPVQIQVSRDDAAMAIELLKDLELNNIDE